MKKIIPSIKPGTSANRTIIDSIDLSNTIGAKNMERKPAVENSSKDRLLHTLLEKKQTVFHICLGFTANPIEAEELTQDIYLKAITRLDTLRDARLASPWLLRITRNTCLNHGRRKSLALRIFSHEKREPITLRSPEIQMETKEKIATLKQAVDTLPAKFKTVFILYEYGDLSYEEISIALNIRPGTVMSRLNRARAGVRTAISTHT